MSKFGFAIFVILLVIVGLTLSWALFPELWFVDYEQASTQYSRMLDLGENYSFRDSTSATAAAIALVAQEDRRIYSREILGIPIPLDVRSCFRAMLTNLKSGSIRQGCSTLAMQLGKMAMKPEQRKRKLWMKLYQLRLSLSSMNRNPDTIVSAFLLHLPCASSHAAGLNACSLLRFGKPADRLTKAEAMVLAGAVQAPGRDLQATDESLIRARKRLGRILNTAWDIGLISYEQAKQIFSESIDLAKAKLDLVNAAVKGRDLALSLKLSNAVQKAKENALNKQKHKDNPDLLVMGAVFNLNGEVLAFSGGDESWLSKKIEAGSWVKPFLVEALVTNGVSADYLDGHVQIPLSLPLYTRTLKEYHPHNAGKGIPERSVPMRYIMKSINTATLATSLYSFIYMPPQKAKQVVRKYLTEKEIRMYSTKTDIKLTTELASRYAQMPLIADDLGEIPGYRQITLASTRMTLDTMKRYVPNLEVVNEDLASLLGVVRANWRDLAFGLGRLWYKNGKLSDTAKLMSHYSEEGTLRWMKNIKRTPPSIYKTATAERNAGLTVLMKDNCHPEKLLYIVSFIALRPSGKSVTPIQGGTLGPALLEMEDECLSGNLISNQQANLVTYSKTEANYE